MSDVILTRSESDIRPGKTGAGLLRLPFALRGKARPDYPATRAMFDYWEQRRGTRAAPARSEIEAAPLADMLRFMFIAEKVAPGVARLRFAGQHLHDVLGMEPRGMPLSCLLAAPSRDELAVALQRVQKGARVQMPLRAPRGLGKPAMDGLLALLPLTDATGRINRVLGMLETHGQIGRTPRRFELTAAPATLDAPQGAPHAAPGEHHESTSRAAAITFADTAPIAGRPAHDARPGWRVIEGGRS